MLLTAGHNVVVSPSDVPTVTVAEVDTDSVLLDVREDHEWDDGHIEGARHIPMFSVPATLAHDPGDLVPEAPIVVVCAVGGRSAQVTAWLVQQGYNARNLAGGMQAWAAAGRPIVTSPGAPSTSA